MKVLVVSADYYVLWFVPFFTFCSCTCSGMKFFSGVHVLTFVYGISHNWCTAVNEHTLDLVLKHMASTWWILNSC